MGPDSGNVIKIDRLSPGDLDSQLHVNGLTWLDSELASGTDPGARVRVSATRFERQFGEAIKKLAEQLRGLGLAEEEGGQIRMPARFMDNSTNENHRTLTNRSWAPRCSRSEI